VKRTVKVSCEAARKIRKIEDELAELGIYIAREDEDEPRPKAKAKSGASVYHYGTIWTTLEHAKLLIEIGILTPTAWATVRKLLKGAGLKRDEIITLGLAGPTTKKKRRKRTKAT
jgi:hypothetical protein